MKLERIKWIGIDYGAKLSGNTAVVWKDEKGLHCRQSEKGKDSDKWLGEVILNLQPESIFIDAPLSLPSVFTGKGEDYFYRECDRICKAMSPMFIGGLTARAMKIKDSFPDINWFETYPGYLARRILKIEDLYQKKKAFDDTILDMFEAKLIFHEGEINNWHRFDAFLAWFSGKRFSEGIHEAIGNSEEGLIIV